MHGCNGCNAISTVYVQLRRNRLCLREYLSKRTFQHHFVCISPFMQRERVLTCCETRFLCVCVCFSACAQKTRPNWVLSCVVKFINMPALLLLPHIDICKSFFSPCSWLNLNLTESLPKSSLPNIFLSFLFDDNFFSMKMSFLSFKKSFRSLSSRCRQWKKCPTAYKTTQAPVGPLWTKVFGWAKSPWQLALRRLDQSLEVTVETAGPWTQ